MSYNHPHPSVITRLAIGLCSLILLLLIPASTTSAAPLFVPAPGVVTAPTQNVPVGSPFSFDVTFTNGADTGYGPYIDLIVPLRGADGVTTFPIAGPVDGVTFNGATFLGTNLTTYTLNITAPGCYNHPIARVPAIIANPSPPPATIVSSAPATFCLTDLNQIPAQLIVLEMPVGSYTPGQPDLTATISGTLSPLADLTTPITYYTRGFFRYGADPLDNPCCDPLYVSHGDGTDDDVTLWPSHDIIPVVAELNKSYVGPEGETATGPNFPKQYVITLEIADTQTLQNVVITDTLPNDVVVTDIVVTSGGLLTPGVDYTLNRVLPYGPAAPADFTVTMLNPVSGADDLTVTYTFYTPEFDATPTPVLAPTTGDDAISNNNASYTASWQPTDPRDPLTPFGAGVGPVGHTNKAIAIQKSVSPLTNPVLPSTLLNYAHAIQISDYFNFGSLTITDVFSDGQQIVDDPAAPTAFDGDLTAVPRLTLTDASGNTLTNFAFTPFFTTADLATLGATPEAICANPTVGAANNLIISTFDIASDGPGVGTGDTEMIFCVSKLWAQQFPATLGVIRGNAAGGTQGALAYQTIVLEEFYDEYVGGILSGDASVDQGDVLDNAVTIRGILHERFSPFNPQGGNPIEEDGSGAGVTIGRGVFEKTIFAINGAPPVGNPPILKVGDVVTYRLRYELPATDIEDLTLTDYLPLPVFDVDGPIGPFSPIFNSVRPGDAGYAITYTPGTAQFGPSDTFSLVYDGSPIPAPAWDPVVTTDSINNTVAFNYGDYDGNNSNPSVIDVLLHVAVQDVVFADGLFLSNFLNVSEGSTNAGGTSANTLIQVEMSRPVMSINKAIVAAEDTDPLNDPVFIPPVPATLNITVPGTPGTRFSPRIYSPGSIAAPGATPADTPVDTIASDLIGAQAGNRVTFMLVLENTGSGTNGAFDVIIRDSIPAGYVTPASAAALNLTATLGDGTPLQIDGLGINNDSRDLFTLAGIQLINNSGSTNDPVCQHIDSGLGQNLIIVTYDLVLAPGVSPLDELQNVAQLINYANQPSGTNLVQGDPLRETATSTIHPPGIDKTVFATSEAHTTGTNVVPGEIVTYQVQVAIPQGTSYNAVLTDTLPASLIPIPGTITIAEDAAISYTPLTPTSGFTGQTLTIDFGDIFNAALDTDTEFVTVQYQARVANTVSHGNTITNTARYQWDYTTLGGPQRGSISDNASVTVVEPLVTINKTVNPTSADAGDIVTYTITITANAARPTAYDLDLTDLLTPHTEIETGTLAYSSGVVGTIVSGSTAGDTLRITFDELAPGQQSTYTFNALILNTVPPGDLINTATVTYTSKPEGVPGVTEPTEKGYTASDPATVNVSASLTKSIVATSEAGSTNPDVLIGEIVRYRLVVQLPEGTSTNLQLLDQIPAGITFLNDGTATAAFVSNLTSQVTSTTLAGVGLNVAGTDPTLVTPTFVLPDDAVSSLPGSDNDTYNAGTDVYLKLGNVTNTNANNAQAEWIIVEFSALVANVGGNTSGVTRNNNFIFRVNDVNLQTSPNVPVIIRLPNIANFTKAITSTPPYDAGNTVTYSITFSNTGTAPAYDVTVTDTLPAVLDLTAAGNVTFVSTGSGSFTNNSNAATDTVDVYLTVLEVGQSVTITVTATIENAAGALQTIANTANLAYSSLPGTNGTSPNGTGSTTPGAPGSTTGERTFPGTSSTNFTTTIPTVNKALVPASPIQFAIGEDMTFNIVVTLPEGTLYNLRVEDAIPLAAPGFTTRHYDFVSGTIITTAAASGGVLTSDFNGTFTTPNPVPSISGTDGNQQTWGFGDTLVPGDNDPSNNTFIVQVVMRYRNIAENQDTLAAQFNRGSVIWQSTSGGTDNTLNAFTGTEVREPLVTTAKLVSDTTPRYDETVTYTINVTNNDTPTAPRPSIAYDVTVVDVINDAELTIVGGVCAADNGGNCVVSPNTPAAGQTTLTATWTSIPVGATYAFTFDASFPATVIPGNAITNSVTTTWTSTPGGNPNERTGTGGVNNYTNTTNVILTPRGLALGNVLWFDDNNNGVFDATETSVGAGVTLTLLDGAGTPTGATAVTNADGSYLFDNLRAGNYIVVVAATNFDATAPSLLQNYRSTTGTEGAPFDAVDHDDGTFSDNGIDETDLTDLTTNGVRSEIIPLALDAEPTSDTVLLSGSGNVDGDDDNNLTVDFGFFRPLSLGNVVWFDANNNGLFDATETPIPGVTVQLYRDMDSDGLLTGADGAAIASTTTLANGSYLFDDLLPGDYLVHIPASNFDATAPSPLEGYLSTTGEELNANTTNVDHPSLTTFNDNGVDSATPETTGITSRTVTLAFTTEPTGELELTGGRGRATDNNSNLTIDFGFFIPMSLGNVVWFDANNNGIYEPTLGELPIQGVIVNLYRDSNADGTPDGGVIATDTTVADGSYLFDALGQDTYLVEIPATNFDAIAPSVLQNHLSSTGAEASPNTNNFDHTDLANLHDNGVDNANPAANGIRSEPVTLTLTTEPTGELELTGGRGVAEDDNSNLTIDFGFYIPMSLGNRVWYDLNNNGLLDGAETGVPGVLVNLYRDDDANGTPDGGIIATDTTDGAGYYFFDNLTQGTYLVQIDATNFAATAVLETYISTIGEELNANTNNVDHTSATTFNDNGVDNAAPATNGIFSRPVTLSAGSEPITDDETVTGSGVATDANSNLTVDFGFFIPMSLGNRVWYDLNNNGLLDGAETGVPGVALNLYRDSNADSTPDGPAIDTTTTDGTGYYLFDNLGQDTYLVEVAPGNFVALAVLENYISSTGVEANPNTNNFDHVDATNFNDNGIDSLTPATVPVRSAPIVLTLGAEPVAGDDDSVTGSGAATDINSNLTVDFGFFLPLSLGNRVWFDDNNNGLLDGTETGVDGVLVELFRATQNPLTDTPLATDITAGGGYYLFDQLPEGDYLVHIAIENFDGTAPSPLAGYRSSTGVETSPETNQFDHTDATNFNDNGIDINAPTDLATTGITSGTVALRYTTESVADSEAVTGRGTALDDNSDLTIDFGFFAALSLGNRVWFDANNNGLLDGAEAGTDGVRVEIYRSTQTPGIDTPLAFAITASGGYYLFDRLAPGDYLVHIPATNWTAGATPLAGYLSSTGAETNPEVNGFDHIDTLNFNDNGLDSATPQTAGITSAVVTLDYGTEPITDDEAVTGLGNATADDNSNLTIDFGFFIPMSLGNVLWYDTNNNGLYEPLLGELPVPAGVQLNLYRASAPTVVIRTTATIAGGYYLFDNLGQDDYIVEVDALAFTAGQPLFTYVSSTGVEADINADVDHIDLLNFHDNGIDNATPATNGIRSATVALVLNNEPTTDDETGSGRGVALDENSNLTVDFGFFIPMSLGNVVWFDANNNGLFEPAAPNNEVGIDNVTVQLFRAGDNPLTDTPLAVTTTTGGGYYLFDGLLPGDYFTFIPTSEFLAGGDLEGYQSSTGVETDLNANVDHVDLSNFHDNGIDPVSPATPATAGVASATVTLAYNTEPGAGDSEVGSGLGVATDINSNLTVDFGFFIPMSLGNLIWEDTDNSGLIDNGEAPNAAFDSVTIELYRDSNTDGTPDTATPLATTTTFGGGYYLFDNLGQDSYIVLIPASQFVFGGPLYGYGSSTPTEVNPNDDADHTAIAGVQENGLNDLQPELNGIRSGTVTLVLNNEPVGDDDTITGTGAATDANSNLTVDFGFFRVLAVGNIVWFDTNNDGLLNGTETGIPNVAVELYNSGDIPGVDTPIDTTTTDAGGFYIFDDLFPGDYIVYIPPSNWITGPTPPLAGYLSSTPTEINPNDNADHDATSGVQENGLNDDNAATNGIASGIITLSYGAELAGEPQGPQGNGTAQIETNANLTVDFGFFLPYALGNRVWFDENNDGLLNGTEAGIENVQVTLFRASDTTFSNPLDTTTTSATGYYLFDRLGADDYIVRVNAGNFATGQPLVGMRSSTGEEATPNTNNYDDAQLVNFNDNGIDNPSFLTAGIVSAAITLGDGEPTTEPTGGLTPLATDANANLTVDFGFFIPMSLGNVVWFDNDDDGIRETVELPVAGVQLSLFRDSDTNGVPDGPALQTTTTTATGFYLFDLLGADSYVVQVTPANFAPAGVLETYLSSTPTEGIGNLDVDQNDNGVNDPAPATNGIFSVPVTLELKNEPPGELQGPQGIGSAATDNNSNLTVDFGFVAPMSLGNFVWYDNNNNGLRDAGEPGVDGVSLTLFAATDTTFSTPLGTATTTGGGFYLFDDLTPGNYVVRIDAVNFTLGRPLSGYFSSTPTETTPNTNADHTAASGVQENGLNPATPGLPVVSGVITLALETEPTAEALGPQANGVATNRNSNLTVDFGFFPLSWLGDRVWNDTNANGVQDAGEPGIAGAIVNLYAAGNLTTPIATTTTDATGFYQFSNLFAGSYVLEFIRPGLDYASSPQNFGSDDAFDSDADPFTGFTAPVTLGFNDHNPTIDAGFYLQTTLPAAIGNFIWYDDNQNGLQDSGETGVPGVEVRLLRADNSIVATTLTDTNGLYLFTGLAPGDYRVIIIPPFGYTVSPQDQGANDAIDSDANPTTGRMVLTTLEGGETDLTWDAGIFLPAATPLRLGDTVWFDVNQNGVQDGGSETGVPGVTVQLFNGSGTFLGQTTTDVNGNYLFTNLPTDDYYLRFLPPTGYLISPQDQGGDDAIDSDANPVTGFTAVFNLPADDLTRDAGLFLDPAISSAIPGSIGTTVWFDANSDGLLNGAELGVPGVEVRLLGASGVVLATAFTDINGQYLFANLAPANYTVEFIAPPGFAFTLANAGPIDTNDSDADIPSGRTTMITLASGENSLIWFAGLVNAPTAVGLISFDAAANANQVTLKWVTAAEIGTSAYRLFRSTTTDFAQATQIAQVPAVGPSTYTYVDPVPAPARYTYWLVEVETSGATTILGSTTATSGPAAANYIVYLPLIIR